MVSPGDHCQQSVLKAMSTALHCGKVLGVLAVRNISRFSFQKDRVFCFQAEATGHMGPILPLKCSHLPCPHPF